MCTSLTATPTCAVMLSGAGLPEPIVTFCGQIIVFFNGQKIPDGKPVSQCSLPPPLPCLSMSVESP